MKRSYITCENCVICLHYYDYCYSYYYYYYYYYYY